MPAAAGELTAFEHAVDRIETAVIAPKVVQRLCAMLADPDVPWPRIEATMAVDGGLVVRALRLASSPAFAGRPVRDLGSAVRVLGSRELRRVVVAAYFAGRGTALGRALWDYALRVALTTDGLVHLTGQVLGPDPFLCGLLHDVGTMAFERIFGADYVALGITPGADDQCERERERFGFDHAELGAMVATRWNLFPELELVTQLHHRPQDCAREGVAAPTRTVIEAVALARVLGRPPSDPARAQRDAGCARLGIAVDAAEARAAEASRRAGEMMRAVVSA